MDDAVRRDTSYENVDWRVLPPGAIRTHFDAPSGRLAAICLGEPTNPRVLLVPGVTGSKEDFLLMMPELAAAGFFVTSFDLAGQYESAHAGPENIPFPRRRYDYDLFVDDLIAVLEIGNEPTHVLGYSFAGIVAQIALSRRPDLFSSLTFLSCPPQPGQVFRRMRRIGFLTTSMGGRLGAALMVWGIRKNVTQVPPHRVTFVNHRFAYTRHKSVQDVIRLMKKAPDLREMLTNSPIPMLVAVGTHDLWPLRLHQTFAKTIGALFSVYRSGHSPCETSPHQLNRDLFTLFAQAEKQQDSSKTLR